MKILAVFIATLAILTSCSETPNSPSGDDCNDLEFVTLANQILGEDHVLSADELETVWNSSSKCRLDPYTEVQLREAARQNKEEGRKWHLVYVFGKSVVEQATICDIDVNSDFLTENWATEKQTSEYVLMDMRAYFGGSDLAHWDDSLAQMDGYQKIKGQIFCEALCSFAMFLGPDSVAKVYETDYARSLIYISDIKDDQGYTLGFSWSDSARNVRISKQPIGEHSIIYYPEGCFLIMK